MAADPADAAPDGAETDDRKTRFGFVAILGATNAGKSTLANRLVGAKVSIVTHKAQTTRNQVLGIGLHESETADTQIVFVDTPGIFNPSRRLERAMVRAAWQGVSEADWVVVLVDAAQGAGQGKISEATETILSELGAGVAKGRVTLALNKIDLIPRDRLLPLSQGLNARALFADTFMISALGGSGIADLKAALAARMPIGDWHYPKDQLADMPQRLLAAEITREQLFLRLHEELPYSIAVETEAWTPFQDGSVRIDQLIYVQRDGQKGIVLGSRGATIKVLGASARKALEETLETKVHLFLRVRVRELWQDDPERYREMGLAFGP